MWQAFEARIDENEQDCPSPLLPAFFAILRDWDLRPGSGITKEMVVFEFSSGDRDSDFRYPYWCLMHRMAAE